MRSMRRAYRGPSRLARPQASRLLDPSRWMLARVHGHSMLPTVGPGDLLLADRHTRVAVGALAVVRLPDATPAVKRVVHKVPGGWWVERDNPRAGVDSWSVGAIAPADVVAVVRLRLWPRPSRLRRVGLGRSPGPAASPST